MHEFISKENAQRKSEGIQKALITARTEMWGVFFTKKRSLN